MRVDPATAELADAIAERVAQKWHDNPPLPRPWLKAAEVATLLRLDVRGLEAMRREGRGPRYSRPTPKMVRYALADVEAWVAEHYEHRTRLLKPEAEA